MRKSERQLHFQSWKTLSDADVWDGLDIFHKWITIDFHDKLSYGNPRVSGGGRSTATELEKCRQERSQENGHQLGRGWRGCGEQEELEESCRPMRLWCGMNQEPSVPSPPPKKNTLYFIIYLSSEMGDIHCLPQKLCYYTTGKCLKCEVRCFWIKIHCCPCQAVDFYEMNFVAVLKVESSFNYQTYWEWLHSRSCYLWHHLQNWIKTCNSCGFGLQCVWPAVNM